VDIPRTPRHEKRGARRSYLPAPPAPSSVPAQGYKVPGLIHRKQRRPYATTRARRSGPSSDSSNGTARARPEGTPKRRVCAAPGSNFPAGTSATSGEGRVSESEHTTHRPPDGSLYTNRMLELTR
jgi:hypothetical protein